MAIQYLSKDVQRFLALNQELTTGEKTLERIFEISTKRNPKEKACIYFDEDGKPISYNYAKYRERCFYLASRLNTLFADVEKGTPVGLKAKNSPNWPLLFWAILMTGHPVLLIDARLPKENAENLLSQAKAGAIIANEATPYSIPSFRINQIRSAKETPDFVPHWANEVIFCSSGTTGAAKMVVMDGENLCGQIVSSYKMGEESLTLMHPGKIRNFAMIPFHHIFGFCAVFLWFTFYGKTIVYPHGSSNRDLLDSIRRGKVTHLFSVPMFWDAIAQQVHRSAALKDKSQILSRVIAYNTKKVGLAMAGLGSSPAVLRRLQKAVLGTKVVHCISGGGYLSPQTMETINGLGYPLYNGYGMTEIGVTSVELSMDVTDRLKGAIGKPLYGVEYKIDKPNDAGEGELLVRCPMIHKKEIKGGKIVETPLEDGFFRTGDIATILEDGRCIIKGRCKDTIIDSNGENVYPDEIENLFGPLPYVLRSAVFGVPAGGREKIVLVLELDNGVTPEGIQEIQKKFDEINETLPFEKKVGSVYLYRKSLPISSSMKVKRFQLRDALIAGSEDFVPLGYRPEASKLENYDKERVAEISGRVRTIFAKTLLLPEYKISDTAVWTTDLGGDSMSYIAMIEDINAEFNIVIPIERYGKIGTVQGFSLEVLHILDGEDTANEEENRKEK